MIGRIADLITVEVLSLLALCVVGVSVIYSVLVRQPLLLEFKTDPWSIRLAFDTAEGDE